MVFSMLLLLVLQMLWLRAEYRSAVDSFNRETNLLFRSTVHQLSDSLFFSMFRMSSEAGRQDTVRFISVVDSTAQGRRVFNIITDAPGNSVDGRSSGVNASNTQAGVPPEPPDGGPPDMRFMFRNFAEAFNEDSLAHHFEMVLADRYDGLPFTILRREADRSTRFARHRQEPHDSIPFTTSFVPLGWSLYAASFDHAGPLLLKRLLPQIGFSLFITLVILLSFLLVYRSLRAQERLLEQKNDFIGNMTHELKTPVATVGVALEAMKSFNVLKDTDKAHLYLDMATQELQRLSMMTDKILQTSVYDYDTEIRQNKAPVDLKTVVEKVIASFSLLAEKKQIHLGFSWDGDASLNGHEQHLTQMVYNLVDNAFKYAGDGPEILITLSGDKDMVGLSVSDKGPGIPEEHVSRVFDKFYRVPTGNVHNVKGYGMGLHYVKGVVGSHGGRITLDSNSGEGAVFRIKLPKQTV